MDLLRYGITARTVEMVCFDAALERLSSLCPDLDINAYKKRVKKEYRAMLGAHPRYRRAARLRKIFMLRRLYFPFIRRSRAALLLPLWMKW